MWVLATAVLAMAMFFLAGWLSAKEHKDGGWVFISCIVGVFSMGTCLGLTWDAGRDIFKMDTPIEARGYEVLATKQRDQGSLALLCGVNGAHDCRAAFFNVYPPANFKEVKLPDGRLILAPAVKQVIVGNSNKMEFVPPKK